MAKESDVCDPELMESEDFLFMLYTSGSTGKPKGIAHSTAGYLLYAMMTQKVSQIFGVCLHVHCQCAVIKVMLLIFRYS